MELEFLEDAYNFVNDFVRKDIRKNTYNKFDFEYTVPSINGISKYQWGKDIESVRPSTLEYILFHLHNAEPKMIIDTLIAYLYYWKIRQMSSKDMRTKYKEVLEHYSIKHDCIIPEFEPKPTVYYISFMVGSEKVYKLGYSNNPTRRFKEIIASVKEHYPFVSVGSFEVIDTETYSTEKIGLQAEKQALNTIKEMKIPKTKIYFDGATEGFSKPIE